MSQQPHSTQPITEVETIFQKANLTPQQQGNNSSSQSQLSIASSNQENQQKQQKLKETTQANALKQPKTQNTQQIINEEVSVQLPIQNHASLQSQKQQQLQQPNQSVVESSPSIPIIPIAQNNNQVVQQKKQPSNIEDEDSWDDDSKFSEEDQKQQIQQKLKNYSQIDGKSQYDFGVDYDEVKNFTQNFQNQNNLFLPGLAQNEQYKSVEHPVQKKHLLVLYLLFRKEVYDQCKGKNRVDLHPSNRGKITIFGNTQGEVAQIVKMVEQKINKISIVKLPIRQDEAVKMKISKKLASALNSKKLIIFKYGEQNNKSYYIGGKGTQSSVLAEFQLIKNYKYKYFRIFDFKNTRSYKIILSQIFDFAAIGKNFQKKWGLKYLQLVDYIPNQSHMKDMGYRPKWQKQKNICVLLTSYTNQLVSPKQMQMELTAFIRSMFYCITLIFNKTQQYLPKLNVEGIRFKIISERRFKRSYLYIICLKSDYELKVKEIIQAVDNLKQNVYGARYFYNLSPSLKEYLRPEHYYFKKYPQVGVYSHVVFAKKDFKFDWKQYLMNLATVQVCKKQPNNQNCKQNQSSQKIIQKN